MFLCCLVQFLYSYGQRTKQSETVRNPDVYHRVGRLYKCKIFFMKDVGMEVPKHEVNKEASMQQNRG